MTESHAPGVVALGGVFLYSVQPQVLADWYAQRLDLKFEHSSEYGAWFARFDYYPAAGPEAGSDADSAPLRYTLFSILTAEQPPRVEGRLMTVNMRVNDLPAIVRSLRAAQWEVTDVEAHAEGRFAWTHDPDGNRLELWEDTLSK